jgi:HAD superfamily hydrolase (TIGR01509 family)
MSPLSADRALPGAVLFDFDGLIVDTETCTYEAVAEIFVEHGVTLDLAWWHSILGTADRPHWTEVLADRLGRPVDRAALTARREARRRVVLDGLPACAGVVELLDAARAAGVPAAVVSSSASDWVVGHLERLGLRDRFARVVTRDDLGGDLRRTKPAPDLFLVAATALAVPAGACVVLEDSPNGVAAARAAGMRVVAVPGPMTATLDFSDADQVVPSVADLDLPLLGALVAGG